MRTTFAQMIYQRLERIDKQLIELHRIYIEYVKREKNTEQIKAKAVYRRIVDSTVKRYNHLCIEHDRLHTKYIDEGPAVYEELFLN